MPLASPKTDLECCAIGLQKHFKNITKIMVTIHFFRYLRYGLLIITITPVKDNSFGTPYGFLPTTHIHHQCIQKRDN